MIQVTAQTRILVAIEPVDFRRGIDGLAALCRSVLKENPFSGTVFVFRSRSGTQLRLLTYDAQGFWLCTKRLSAHRFRHWPAHPDAVQPGAPGLTLLAHELAVLLAGGNPAQAKGAPLWKPLPPSCSAGISTPCGH